MEQLNATNNRQVITSLYTESYQDLRQYLLAYTHDVMAAEDMLQDLFEKLLSLDLVAADTVRHLAFVMAKRMIIDDARHKAFVRESEHRLAQSQQYYESGLARRVESRQMLALVNSRLDRMAPKRAEVFRLYHEGQLSAQEIADQLQLSRRTVETHIYNASKEMKQFLKAL